jgi:hypothetical protein
LPAKKSQLQILRESESQLEAQLLKLRQRIASAERGENKRIKDALKYIARTNRTIARTSAAQERIQEKELEKLEKFLDESFESVQEAREALAKQTRKATTKERTLFLQYEIQKEKSKAEKTKSANQKVKHQRKAASLERELTGSKLDPSKKYSVRKLSEIENQKLLDFMSDKLSFDKLGDGYLLEGEVITVSVPYKYIDGNGRIKTQRAVGRKVFRNWHELRAYIYSYWDNDPDSEDWFGDIEILKFEEDYQYRIARGKQVDTNTRNRRERKAYFNERARVARAKHKAEITTLKQENKKLKKQLKGRK